MRLSFGAESKYFDSRRGISVFDLGAITQSSGRQRLNIYGPIDLETGKTSMLDVPVVDALMLEMNTDSYRRRSAEKRAADRKSEPDNRETD